ncbi:hypothetical protein ABB37_02125 [Leptomonas pyrrhocoris]|uniref:Inositol 1,4,5-trisphosphate/ryanodine receptor domain-containing protein n=1 Tax=Leptomonas pyrrhocoris TaxID=157538 RepID=A0A0N0VGQ3_LEPPY|nr:hypothetical protein ABB37_02125 [Leptomonas pyrrhocoris]KPA83981.1 hypothetical protein ABB37_02125 [Leptomonas pyrrhocoris]|eukprot:XP_015662420.1 hypothetical protein ABB37_02125 [Leptomonas pyrrhocoris]
MDRAHQTVKFFGLVYFECKDGYLAASGLDGERLFLRTQHIVGDTADEVLRFFGFADVCVFRVVPTLSSRAATSSVKGASGASPSQSSRGGGSSRSNGDGGGIAAGGDKTDAAPACTSSGLGDSPFDPNKVADVMDMEDITYGKSLSLVHEASGLYVSVAQALPSENDPDCLSVVLVKPSAAMTPSCELSLVSRYKLHAEGDKLCRADSVLIRLDANPMFIHVSSSPMMEPSSGGNNDGDVELLHRTFRLGSSLSYASGSRTGPAGGVGGGGAAVAAASTTLPSQSSRLTLQGSFVLPVGNPAAAVPGRCSTAAAAEALTLEYLDEVNACEEGGVSFTLQRYDVGSDYADRQRAQLRITRPYIACGVPIALYHRERESFLMTSATQFPQSVEMEGEERGDDDPSRGNTNNATSSADDRLATPGSSLLSPTLHRTAVESAEEVDIGEDCAATVAKNAPARPR